MFKYLRNQLDKNQKVFFVNKRRHLEFVYTSIDSVSGTIFYDFRENSVRNFFYRPVNTDKPNFVSFLVFVGTAASFTAKIHLSKLSRN